MKKVPIGKLHEALLEMELTKSPFIIFTEDGREAIVRPVNGDEPTAPKPDSPELTAAK